MSLQSVTRKLRAFAHPIQNSLLKWLYLHLPPQPITTKKAHRAYSTVASILLRERAIGTMNPTGIKAITMYLHAITPFIEDFEKSEFSTGGSSPEETLRFLMDQHGLSQYDLAGDLGGQSTVSNILHGKRRLSRVHIERLSKRFHIKPSAFYAG